jgi:hypothetical protein
MQLRAITSSQQKLLPTVQVKRECPSFIPPISLSTFSEAGSQQSSDLPR